MLRQDEFVDRGVDRFYTISAAARLINKSEGTVRNWLRDGQLVSTTDPELLSEIRRRGADPRTKELVEHPALEAVRASELAIFDVVDPLEVTGDPTVSASELRRTLDGDVQLRGVISDFLAGLETHQRSLSHFSEMIRKSL